jgi:hypothetical protein
LTKINFVQILSGHSTQKLKSLKSLVHCQVKNRIRFLHPSKKDRNFPISKIGRTAAKIGRTDGKKSDGREKKTDLPLFM